MYRVKVIACIILVTVVLFFGIEFICWRLYLSALPDRADWFQDDFAEGISDWRTLDTAYIPLSHEAEGVMLLAKDKFFAPSAMRRINLTQMGQETFVFYFRIYSGSFQGDAVTLGSIVYSTGILTIIQNKEGQLGIATELMDEAVYSTGSLSKVKQDEWQDIYLVYHNGKNTVELMNGKSKALTLENYTISVPLSEIWLGAIWIGGSENYGAPVNMEYDEVAVSNLGILPKPTFIEFIVNQFI